MNNGNGKAGQNGNGAAQGGGGAGALDTNGYPHGSGGLGEVLAGPTHTREDARMVGRAVRERWAMPAEAFRELGNRSWRMAQSEDERRAARGADLLLKMNKQNQDDDHHSAGPPEIVVRLVQE